MAASFKFAIIALAAAGARDERINVGALVITENGLDIRVAKRLDRVRAISAAIDTATLRDLVNGLHRVDEELRKAGATNIEDRLNLLSLSGPIALSAAGTFVADQASYEDRLSRIMKSMVDAEPAVKQIREKRSRLLTQMKKIFRQERILAQRGEGINSHRIVSSVEMEEGLVADLVLRNGVMHVIETVDASSEVESPRKTLGDIGISALVLGRAKMKFGDNTSRKLVYSASSGLEKIAKPSLETVQSQGVNLINWMSGEDRGRFVHSLSSLAIPVPKKSRGGQGSGERIRFS